MPLKDTLEHLGRLYAASDDPWNHRGSAYEAAKYDAALADLPHARVVWGAASEGLPDLRPDLVVMSEVLYFLTPVEIATLGAWLRARAARPVIAVNWTGPTDEPLDGPQAMAILQGVLGPSATTAGAGYRIDLFA